MGVNHGGTDVGVPEQFLNRADVVAIFQKMRGEAMTHGVRPAGFEMPAISRASLTAFWSTDS